MAAMTEMASIRLTWLLGALALVLWALEANAQPVLDRVLDSVQLEDVIDVEILGRDIVAVDGLGSGILIERLELGESVQWTGARGRVALVLTDRRALAATPGAGNWRAVRYRLGEAQPRFPLLAERVALLVTDQRALGFSASGGWLARNIGPHEWVRASRIGPSTAVIVTDRRALGFSPRGRFFETDLRLHEDIESVSAGSGMARVTTSQRILVFQGSSGTWRERRRPLF